MAANTEEEDAGTDAPFSDLLHCGICLERYRQPRSLPCLHTFCTPCLENHVLINASMQGIGTVWGFCCPACREHISLPRDGVAGFRRDFRIEQVSEFVQEQSSAQNSKKPDESNKKALQSQTRENDKVMCEVCLLDCQTNACYFCRDCDKIICQICKARHCKILVFKNHSIQKTRSSTDGGDKTISECTLHPGDKISYVCKDCSVPICGTCVIRDHENHIVMHSDACLQDYIEGLSFQHKNLVAKKAQFETLMTRLNESETQLHKDQTSISKKIKTRVDTLIEEVYKQERKLFSELQSKCSDELDRLSRLKSQVLRAVTKMNFIAQKTGEILRQPQDIEMVQLYNDCTQQIDKILEDNLLIEFQQLQFSLDFWAATTSKLRLGKLVFTVGEIKNKECLAESPEASTTTSPGNESKSLRDTALLAKSDRQTVVETRNNVQPVATNEEKRSQKSLKNPLKLFSLKLQAEKELTKKSEARRKSKHQSVSTSDLLVVAAEGGDASSEHTARPERRAGTDQHRDANGPQHAVPEAVLMAKFGKAGNSGGEFNSPRDATFLPHTDQFVIVDTNNDRLQVFNRNGLLTNVIGQGQVKPWGVACTRAGEIVVTDNTEKCVKIFDTGGKLVDKIGSFLCPYAITVTVDDKFVVTDFFSTYVYKLNREGELVSQFQYRSYTDHHACGASRLAVTSSNNVVISDISNACVKCFDITGRFLWKVPSGDVIASPQGIATSPDDVIYVTDALDHGVVLLNSSGTTLGRLTVTGPSLNEATGIAISSSGKYLVITRLKANQVRMYELEAR